MIIALVVVSVLLALCFFGYIRKDVSLFVAKGEVEDWKSQAIKNKRHLEESKQKLKEAYAKLDKIYGNIKDES